jgi:threonine synthase
MTDDDYLAAVDQLTAAIEDVDKGSLRITPLVHSDELDLTIKNETVNISGSHKGRHLIGTALHLEIAKRAGQQLDSSQPLAIASCGNAALAAAVVAKASKRDLRVFVPPWADTNVVSRLKELGAQLVVCERLDEDKASCQGGDNALALLGGHNLGWELIDQSEGFDHLFIQVGGGALASSIMQAYSLAKMAGVIATLPRFHAVQTDNAHPLARAWHRLQRGTNTLDQARRRRSEYMWPWQPAPTSVASGILDDETYDWFSIARGLSESRGSVITVSEDQLIEAQALGQSKTGIAVDATGTAGLAGLLKMRHERRIPDGETCAVLFTGAIR